jgi:hypothetical protein
MRGKKKTVFHVIRGGVHEYIAQACLSTPHRVIAQIFHSSTWRRTSERNSEGSLQKVALDEGLPRVRIPNFLKLLFLVLKKSEQQIACLLAYINTEESEDI